LNHRTAPPGAKRGRPFGIDLSLEMFDRATRIARSLFIGGQSLVVLIQDGVAWRSRDFGAALGPRDWAAELVISTGETLWIEDGRLDPRCKDEPLVVQAPFLRTWIAVPIRLENGSTPGVLCVVHTEPQPYDPDKAARLQDLADFVADEWARAKVAEAKRKAERALDTAESHFTALAETMPISLVMTDMSQRVIAASRAWRDGLGLTKTPIVGRTLVSLSSIYEPYQDLLRRALQGETVGAVQLAGRRADRSKFWLQADINIWRNARGRPGGLVITANDVSELRAALDAAKRSTDRLNLALDLSDVHVWELDYVRRQLFKAGAEETFFDRPQTYEGLYRDIYVSVDPRDREMVREAWRRHVEDGAPFHPHYRVARGDGKEVWVEGVLELFTDETGRPRRMVGAIRNITAAKHAEQRLMQAIAAAEAANRAKSQFLATMSHEIRTPLNGVLGMAQAMDADALSDLQRGRLGVIRDSGHSLLTILNDVLDISKIEAGKLELEQAPFDLDDLAQSARHAFVALAERKGLSLILKVDAAALGVYRGDATRLRQILYNLISNAVKFTEAGAVTVSVARRGERVRFAVSDTGIGIARADMARLFEKFEQADASTTRRFGGSGLGLSICRQLAQMMGGEIRARSVDGAGTTFTVSVPLAPIAETEVAEPVATHPAPHQQSPHLRVLAAEDNEINQLVLKTLLSQVGVEPVVVGDGAAALAAWEAGDWDVILMDVQMPRLDGPAAARAIRRRERELGRAHTPIVALTANAMAHQVAEYRAAGMDDFVAKPIEVGQLYAALQRVLDASAKTADVAAVA
jgi:PAS domain S-box-containing protein